MIPEVKVNHWKWCEVQGNSPHERWEWLEVDDELDVYTALWLANKELIDIDDYIIALSETQWAKGFLETFMSEAYYNDLLTEEGFDVINAFLLGIKHEQKFNIEEDIYINKQEY